MSPIFSVDGSAQGTWASTAMATRELQPLQIQAFCPSRPLSECEAPSVLKYIHDVAESPATSYFLEGIFQKKQWLKQPDRATSKVILALHSFLEAL